MPESDDGIHFRRDNQIAIDFSGPEEYAICKPCVVTDKDGYKMWFCARGQGVSNLLRRIGRWDHLAPQG